MSDEKGSPAANQGKREPMPVTPTQPDPNAPLTPPPLEDMNVGSADPQTPRHPAAAGSGLSVDGDVDPGPEHARQDTHGESHRVPGLMGRTGADEAVETDVDAGAAQMGPAGPSSVPSDGTPGHSQGVPVPASDALRNSSEEHAVVRGARTPRSGGG